MQGQQYPKHLLRRPLHPIPRSSLRTRPPFPLDHSHFRRLHRRRRSRPRTLLRDPIQFPGHPVLLDGVLHRHRRGGTFLVQEEWVGIRV